MWSASEETPGTMEGEPPGSVAHAKEKCEQNKNQLESLKEIMLKNKQTLKKKEEEVQEYARRLSKIKSRAKLSRRSKEGSAPCKDATQSPKSDAFVPDALKETIDDVSQAKTSKAKSTLLQKKLAENRKAFEQRSKEITETKRAVEEKVEAIRQQLDEQHSTITGLQKDQLSVTPIRPVVVTSDVMSPIQIDNIQEKERKIMELSNKILELEATVLDLQENLKEKDSVIDSKTRAVTLMTADLSKKGKTTLDTLEDTKDEMRTMQEHFVLLETSLKNKNDNLLEQLQERNNKIVELEESVTRFEQQMNEQKLSESASADFSRSTMDTLVETKDAMKSMQENFILIESSLRANNENLLQQLNEYELKLAEANKRIFNLESGIGIVKDPSVDELYYKLEKLERSNKQLQDEKYELQKSIAEIQDKIVNRSIHGNGALMEKDNRIAELETLVEELKQSNNLLEEESKTELQKQLAHLTLKNDEYSNKVTDLEKMVHDLEAEKNDIATKLPHEKSTAREDQKVETLTKELEDLNKTMIKIKAQHRSKIKNLQKQLENFKKVSDTNAELVKLGNQVAVLEEEKGNLQLSLVDFDELKASAGDWQERIADLETKVATQTKEIQMNIEAIATLENQKLDLMQELHTSKQEVAALEAENAESENLRVTAEMKVVDLEEQLESIQKSQSGNKSESSLETYQSVEAELIKRIEVLSQENSELYNKIAKMEEKGASDSGSTESFEAIHESEKTDQLKKIEDLTQKNSGMKLNKSEEKGDSHAGSTESFETIHETDKNELLKKIDQLAQENTDLTMKLNRIEEKGSSDTGSTESFERIPEHNEGMTKIELLTQENNELVIKLTKLQEQFGYIATSRIESPKSDADTKLQIETLLEENNNKSVELTKLKLQVTELIEENNSLEKRIEALSSENNDLVIRHTKLEERIHQSEAGFDVVDRSRREVDSKDEIDVLQEENHLLEKEVKELRNALEQSNRTPTEEIVNNELKSRIEELLEENGRIVAKIAEVEEYNQKLKDNLREITEEKEGLRLKINQTMSDDVARERLELIDKLEKLNQEKESVAQERKDLHEEISTLLHKSNEELPEPQKLVDFEPQEAELMMVATLEREIEESKKLIAEQAGIIQEMKIKLAYKEEELEEKTRLIAEYEASGKKAESLDNELKEMLNTVEEWKHKCNEMQEKMQILESGKTSIEEGFKMLQNEHELLLVEKGENDMSSNLLKQQLESTVTSLESRLQDAVDTVSAKDNEIASLKVHIQDKDRELSAKYTQLQNEMIAIDSLQDELNNNRIAIQEKDAALSSMSDEIANLYNAMRSKEEEIYFLRKDNDGLDEKLRESKSSEEYHELLEQLKNKDMALNEVESGLNVATKTNEDLSEKVNNLSQRFDEIQSQLIEKQQELADLLVVKEQLDAEITETKNDKSEAEKRVWELQGVLENQSKFVEELQTELRNGYKQIELLKVKHTEDTEMQNHRLENIIEELNNKTQECEVLRGELQEKERLVGQNFTEEVKVTLEAKVAELEQKLTESEEKIQAQLEKMKKIAANLKKKTVMCQEFDARVAELEEKWTTEKDEKEAKNKQIQEVEILMREKDNKIVDLEEKLTQARNETTETMKRIDSLTKDLDSSREKMSILTQQITEMEEEIVRLREDLEVTATALVAEKQAKEKVSLEFESYKQDIIRENEKKQLELDEVKERARELSVRMQVMETEYLEQLAQITNLKAENGLLLSKQTQINEKLEDTEKESEGRRMLIEKLQKEIAGTTEMSTETVTTQTVEEFTVEEATGTPSSRNCDHCEQCQTLMHTLEAKLQEREAQIENLDNELANSTDNFGQVRESTRYNDTMNQTDMGDGNSENPSNDLPLQYNTLLSSFEAMKLEFSDALKENRELVEKIEGLQCANATLEEKIVAGDQTLEEIKERAEKLQSEDASSGDLLKKYQERETELLSLQKELQVAEDRAYHLEEQLNSQIASLEIEKQQLTGKEKFLMDIKNSLENEIESLKANRDSSQKKIENLEIELKIHKQGGIQSETESTIVKREVSALDIAQDDRGNVPPLFDASKIFGTPFASDSDVSSNKEIIRLQNLLDEKEAQYTNFTQEIDHLQKQMIEERSKMLQDYNHCTDQLRISQEQLQAARAMQEHLEQIVIEKNMQIDTLSVELSNISLQSTMQHDQQNYTDKLNELLLAKDKRIGDLTIDLNSTKEELERIIAERNEQNHSLEAYKQQITNLEGELRNSTDSELIQELEHRISAALKERDLLQLQVNDLTRSMEELKDSFEVGQNLQVEIERAHRERDEAKELVVNLTQALEDSRRSVADKAHIAANLPIKASSSLEESAVSYKHAEDETSKPIDETFEQVAHLEIGSTWDMGSSEKLNVDEETWGWNADDVQLVDDQHLTMIVPSVEIQLRAKVDDLEDRIKDLEAEKEKVIEENKAAQVRSGKMIKKLKEYKVLMESLQQQLKIQKSASDFYELDSAIEQELKSQISKLEKSLSDVREEHKNTAAEKDALMKRLDVVVSANERYMEMKERQDMDMEVLRIRNRELTDKIEALDRRLQQNVIDLGRTDGSPSQDLESVASKEVKLTHDRIMKQSSDDEDVHALCTKYREEIDDLKDEMEALAMENEQLQHFLEEQKTKLSTLESKRVADEDVSIQIVEDLNKRIFELQGMLSKSKEDYDLLRKQYEQSLMDANDQVSIMRQNTDFIKGESLEKTNKLLMEISDLRQQVEASDLKVVELQTNLQDVMQAKENLEEKLAALAASSEKQLFTVNSSMAEVTDLLNVRIQEVADLRQELQRQYVGHEEEKAKLHSSMQELVQELNEKKQELENLRQSFSNKEMDLIQQQSVEAVSALVSQATQELVQKHAIEIEGKDKEIRNLKETTSTLQLAMDEYLLEMQNNATKADAEQQELELLKQSLIEKDALLDSIQSELLSVKQELTGKQSQLSGYEGELKWFKSDNEKYSLEIENLRRQLTELTVSQRTNVPENTEYTQNLQYEIESLRTALQEKLTVIDQQDQESKQYKTNLESYQTEINELRIGLQEFNALRSALQEKTEKLNYISMELETTNTALEETKKILAEKVSLLESSDQMLIAKQTEIENLLAVHEQHHRPSNIVDGIPLFRMGEDSQDLQTSVDSLQEELQKKQEEIENLKYILNENTYPSIIREMQERINCLYNEKAELESSLETATQSLTKREQQIEDLKQQVQIQNQEFVSKEETTLLTRERRSTQDQDEIVKLQNELHVKEQEINELKYIIAEKDSQLSLQASMEPQSDDFELREMVQRLTTELYGKEQEIQYLRSTIAELQKEATRVQEFERLCEESKQAIQQLTTEKEQVRLEAQELLERKLHEKEVEIDELKQRLAIENRNILDELHLRDKDIENLKKHLEESFIVAQGTNDKLRQTEEQFLQINTDLAEKERRLAELSVTKEAELHNLKLQIHEKDVRIEELLALSQEEEKQLVELRNSLEARETEINALKKLLEDKVKEYELIENALKKDVSIIGASTTESIEGTNTEGKESASQELDLALYMLHQRDVRCEELTHELMQLLEERDTLQLRLSNAIRVNEDLRRVGSSELSPKDVSTASGSEEPVVEHPSPSKSVGPVEIAKEAIDAPIGEDREALAVKLSQLHTVSHTKDVRLMDEREMRHTQQMSLLAHKDVLSTLPPEAAARLVNANYTLSRDVQSQSSVLLNWLWGKSTPKVVHM